MSVALVGAVYLIRDGGQSEDLDGSLLDLGRGSRLVNALNHS